MAAAERSCTATLSGWHVWRLVRCTPLGEERWPTNEEREQAHEAWMESEDVPSWLWLDPPEGITCQTFARCLCGAERVPGPRELNAWEAGLGAARLAMVRAHAMLAAS